MTRTAYTALLGALILALVPGGARADAAAGGETFKGNGCTDCHYTDGPAKEKTIDDQLAKKGPELWYAGSKFQQEWLQAWLAKPEPIRPMA
jgi:cytochrome c2